MLFDWEWIEKLNPTMRTVLAVVVLTFVGVLIVASIIGSAREKKRGNEH